MNSKLTRLLSKRDKVQKELDETIKLVQSECKHQHLAECGHHSFGYDGGALPPLRICLDCGMTEEGWGPGYVVLKGESKNVSREEVYQQRLGLAIGDHHKGPLLRKEITVKELIEKECR